VIDLVAWNRPARHDAGHAAVGAVRPAVARAYLGNRG
jgi:hypothetical protein